MRYQGRDIFAQHTPRSGVTYNVTLQWIFAAVWANYTPTAFLELAVDDQSLIIAAYEAHEQIRSVLEYEQVKKLRQSQKQKPLQGNA